jgi:hypothetical protein
MKMFSKIILSTIKIKGTVKTKAVELKTLVNGRRWLAETCWVRLGALWLAEIGDRVTS